MTFHFQREQKKRKRAIRDVMDLKTPYGIETETFSKAKWADSEGSHKVGAGNVS